MKSLIKVVLSMLGAIVLLALLAALILPLVFDTDDLKEAIGNEVARQTGRELSIDGDLNFSVFPWVAVEVSELSLSNAAGFGESPFASIGQARVGVALVPLFRKQISIDEITLEGLELSLQVDASGRNNWEDLAAASESDTPAESSENSFESQRIAGLRLERAVIGYRDEQAGTHYRLEDFSLLTGALGDGQAVPVELSGRITDLVSGDAAGLELSTVAAIDLKAGRHTFENIDLRVESSDISLAMMAPKLDLDQDSGIMTVNPYAIELAGMAISGALEVTRLSGEPEFSGTLQIAEFSPADIMDRLGMGKIQTTDPAALQSARIEAGLSGSTTAIDLDEFVLVLDQTRFDGQLSVTDFSRPTLRFELAADGIDLDRYMAPADEAQAAESVALPDEELAGPDVQGTLTAGQLRLAGLDFGNAELGLVLRDSRLRVHPLTAEFYGGRYSGDITVDGSGEKTRVSIDEHIDSITFQRLVADLVESDAISGTAEGHVKLSGYGDTSTELLTSLNGDVGLTLLEGALEGINIWYEIRRGMALYKGLEMPEPEPARTVFSRMKLDAGVNQGIVTTRDLVAELPFLAISGDGAIDLGASELDLGLVARVSSSPELRQDPLGAELEGKRVPFRLSGSLSAPEIAVDWEALLKSEATDLLLERIGLVGEDEDNTGDAGPKEPGEDQEPELEDVARGALFELLRGKDRDKDKDDKEDGSG